VTIKIKAPRHPANGCRCISESTYRRILALVRACENDEPLPPLIGQAIDKLKAQCEKENAK